MSDLKRFSSITILFVTLFFALDIYLGGLETIPNITTWIMLLIFSTIGFTVSVKRNRRMELFDTVNTILIFLIVLAITNKQEKLSLGTIDIIFSFLFCFTIIFWKVMSDFFHSNKRTKNERKRDTTFLSIVQGFAVIFSFIPQMASYWKEPDPSSAYFWFWLEIYCIIAILTTPKQERLYNFTIWVWLAINFVLIFLVLRLYL